VRISRILAAIALSAVPVALTSGGPAHAAEGCGAFFSGGATGISRCTYVASANGAVVASSTSWRVTVNRGGAVTVLTGAAPEYRPSTEGRIRAGDIVTAEVFAPGSVIVGSATEGSGVVPPQP